MEMIFLQLKRARESRGLSVADVATATRINPEFLIAIEEGRTTILPQTYVRAFLREFASVVGLDPQKVMDDYDAETARTVKPEKLPEKPPPQLPVIDSPSPVGGRPKTTGIAAVASVLVLSGILYWNYSRPASDQVEPVRPQKENTRTSTNEKVVRPAPPPEKKPETVDSLRLGATTSDTVWVQIVIDSRDSLDYILKPKALRTWKAGNSFRVSVGRPESVHFTLNGVDMGTLGNDVRIVRDSPIDRRTLARLGKQD